MNARRAKGGLASRVAIGVLPLALLALPLHADTGPVYELSYTLGQDALSTLDVFAGSDGLRPGFRNDVQRSREVSVGVRSTRMPSVTSPGLAEHSLDTSGGFVQRFGSSGFGYGVDVGLGLRSSASGDRFDLDDPAGGSSFVVTDLSTGPTFETGNLRSRVRVGVRYPLLGEGDATTSSFYGHRGDTSRSAGYLSLDSRLRFSNQAEMSVSLFYDDYGLGGSRDWLSDRLDFQSGTTTPESVIGFEMGLNF